MSDEPEAFEPEPGLFPGLTSEDYQAIGRITVELSEIEKRAWGIVVVLSGTSFPVAGAMLKGSQLDRLLDRIESLLNLEAESRPNDPGPNLGERISKWGKAARDVNVRRNDTVHANYRFTLDWGDPAHRVSLRSRDWFEAKRVSIPEILPALAGDAERVRIEGNTICGHLFALVVKRQRRG